MRLALLLFTLLTGCHTTRAQRLQLYQLAATATGHPEAAALIATGRRILTEAKQPRVQP